MDSAFQFDQYTLKKQVLALTGILRVFNTNGKLVVYCHQKMFKLKEDIRVYSDESKTLELLNIKARQVLDFSAYYDVFDSLYGTKIGALRRKGLRSILKDEWEIFDREDTLIGTLREDAMNRALLRRFLLGALLPQDYDLMISSEHLANYKQRFNPFQYTLDMDFRMDTNQKLDRRLGLVCGILLAIIEGHQHN